MNEIRPESPADTEPSTSAYDELGEREQSLARKVWAERSAALRANLDYATEFDAQKESYSAADQDGNLIIHTPND